MNVLYTCMTWKSVLFTSIEPVTAEYVVDILTGLEHKQVHAVHFNQPY